MQNRKARDTLLIAVAAVVAIHFLWPVITIFLPWAMAGLIFMTFGSALYYRKWRR